MNLSGIGVNRVFKTGIEPAKPYYYVSGSLDLAGAVYGGTYFFNFDDSLKYASTRDYANFIMVDENAVISEVLVYSGPDLVAADDQKDLYFAIGGADYKEGAPDNQVKVWWAAPAGIGPFNFPPAPVGDSYYNGYPLTADEIAAGPVNYFGHEGGHFPYDKEYDQNTGLLVDNANKRYKFLAVTLLDVLPDYPENVFAAAASGAESKQNDANEEVIIIEEARSASGKSIKALRERKRVFRNTLPTGDKAVESGRLTVVLKIYPKIQ